MKTYTAEVCLTRWCDKHKYDIAAPTFLQAWQKLKKLMRKNYKGFGYTVLSITQTATLDA